MLESRVETPGHEALMETREHQMGIVTESSFMILSSDAILISYSFYGALFDVAVMKHRCLRDALILHFHAPKEGSIVMCKLGK